MAYVCHLLFGLFFLKVNNFIAKGKTSIVMTDSVGSRSDTSAGPGFTTSASNKFKMDAVCVIDLHHIEQLNHRKKAFEEVRQACTAVNANCHHVQVSNPVYIIHSYLNTYFYIKLMII